MKTTSITLAVYCLLPNSENDLEMSAQEQKQTIANLKMSFDEKASPYVKIIEELSNRNFVINTSQQCMTMIAL